MTSSLAQPTIKFNSKYKSFSTENAADMPAGLFRASTIDVEEGRTLLMQ